MPRSHVCPEEEAEEEEEEVCVFVMCALRQHKPQGPALVIMLAGKARKKQERGAHEPLLLSTSFVCMPRHLLTRASVLCVSHLRLPHKCARPERKQQRGGGGTR